LYERVNVWHSQCTYMHLRNWMIFCAVLWLSEWWRRAAFIANRQLIPWDNAFKEELPEWTLNSTKWRICTQVKYYCNQMYTTFVFKFIPGVCKLEKCSLSPFLVIEVRVRFQTRRTKKLSRPPRSVPKSCCDYARQDLPQIKPKFRLLPRKPNLKKSKLRNRYLWENLRKWAGVARAAGRTGRFFIVPQFDRVPSIGDRSIRTHEFEQQQAELECVTDSERRPLYLATENNYWIIYFCKSHYSRPQLRPLKP